MRHAADATAFASWLLEGPFGGLCLRPGGVADVAGGSGELSMALAMKGVKVGSRV